MCLALFWGGGGTTPIMIGLCIIWTGIFTGIPNLESEIQNFKICDIIYIKYAVCFKEIFGEMELFWQIDDLYIIWTGFSQGFESEVQKFKIPSVSNVSRLAVTVLHISLSDVSTLNEMFPYKFC